MHSPDTQNLTKRYNWWTKRNVLIAVFVSVAVLMAANAHLVYVAFSSAPDCVSHLKESGVGTYHAAKPAC